MTQFGTQFSFKYPNEQYIGKDPPPPKKKS